MCPCWKRNHIFILCNWFRFYLSILFLKFHFNVAYCYDKEMHCIFICILSLILQLTKKLDSQGFHSLAFLFPVSIFHFNYGHKILICWRKWNDIIMFGFYIYVNFIFTSFSFWHLLCPHMLAEVGDGGHFRLTSLSPFIIQLMLGQEMQTKRIDLTTQNQSHNYRHRRSCRTGEVGNWAPEFQVHENIFQNLSWCP